jgi:MFS family permease
VNSYGGVVRPSVTSLISQQADKREQGVVLGLTSSIIAVSQIIAPVIAGSLIDRGLLNVWALLTAAVAFVGMLVSLRTPDQTAAAAPVHA